jgi:hypothetical protein
VGTEFCWLATHNSIRRAWLLHAHCYSRNLNFQYHLTYLHGLNLLVQLDSALFARRDKALQ